MHINSDLIEKYKKIIFKNEIYLLTSLSFVGNASKFVNSLLDSHDELFTCPHSVNNILTISHEEKLKFKRNDFSYLKGDNFNKIIKKNDYLFNTKNDEYHRGYNHLGENFDKYIKLDKEKFIFLFESLIKTLKSSENNLKNQLLTFFICFNWCQNFYPKSNKFIIYTHDPANSIIVQNILKSAKYLSTSRYPINAYATRMRNRFLKNTIMVPMIDFYDQIHHHYDFCKIKDDIGVVIIEELHNTPEDSLKKLCKHLNINYSNQLLQTTVCNITWHNNRRNIYTGFDINRHNFINTKEVPIYLVKKFSSKIPNFLNYLGYPHIENKLKINEYLSFIFFINKYFLKYITQSVVNIFRANISIKTKIYYLLKFLKEFSFSIFYTIFSKKKLNQTFITDEKEDFKNKLLIINPFSENIYNKKLDTK